MNRLRGGAVILIREYVLRFCALNAPLANFGGKSF